MKAPETLHVRATRTKPAAKTSGSDVVQETFLNAQRAFSDFHGATEREFTA